MPVTLEILSEDRLLRISCQLHANIHDRHPEDINVSLCSMSSNWCHDIENVTIGPYKMITLMKVGTLDCENSTQVQFQEGNNENLLIW